MERDYIEVTLCGLGGQGILIIGRTLAEAGTKLYKHVNYFANYTAAMRGGESECTVILSQQEISAPAILEPQSAILMSPGAFDEFEGRVKPNGLVVIDSSLITKKSQRKDWKVIEIPATMKALEMGNSQVANFILLGAFIQATQAVPLEVVEMVIEQKLATVRREALVELNKIALREGVRACQQGR